MDKKTIRDWKKKKPLRLGSTKEKKGRPQTSDLCREKKEEGGQASLLRSFFFLNRKEVKKNFVGRSHAGPTSGCQPKEKSFLAQEKARQFEKPSPF